jgi:hypothetical protein
MGNHWGAPALASVEWTVTFQAAIGLPPAPVLTKKPSSAEIVDLGGRLFFDPLLSDIQQDEIRL